MKGVFGVEVTYPMIFPHAFETNRALYLHMTILHFGAQTEIYENYDDLSRTPKPYQLTTSINFYIESCEILIFQTIWRLVEPNLKIYPAKVIFRSELPHAE